MKLLLLLSLLALTLVQEGACTHLETCDCNEIRELVNATVQEATDRLEYKLSNIINNAIAGIDTIDKADLADMEKSLTSTMERLLKPIQSQLDYHLSPPPANTEDNPATSCKALYDKDPDTPSGYYWISTSGSPVRVYCSMSTICGNYTGGWMRVANIDMRNTSHQCPSGLTLVSRSSAPQRLCDITSNGCVTTLFTVHGVEYSHVYGRIIAYQNGYTIAFHYTSLIDIEKAYVFGVSLTHGQSPRKHIWTFAGASDEANSISTFKCPCINTNQSPPPTPSFIGNDYFCDTSLSSYYGGYSRVLFPEDPLWDGEGCGPTNTCCSFRKGCSAPPWFVKDLPSSTTDDIEMRLCRPLADGSTPLEIVELYVQ